MNPVVKLSYSAIDFHVINNAYDRDSSPDGNIDSFVGDTRKQPN